ncbi:MAG: flagellar filament capping protein FliD [Lachnospiraceae bacterium]|nr:flagellar filament capping protein FliD [Lachnospiraceae bacterium]
MAMRLSGLMSGMDTESIISQLVDARKVKVDKAKKAQKTVNYKQEAWKSLNTKLKGLQGKYLSNMRFTTAYAKKTSKISDSSVASVITGEGAVKGVQTLEVESLAKTAYLTGGELGDGKQGYTALSTLKDLGVEFDESGEGKISIADGSKSVDITVNENTTISDVLTQLKDFGLNASFDEKNQRFFVSAKESGEANDFSISFGDTNGENALKALGLSVDPNDTTGKGATKVDGKNAVIYLNDAKFTNSSNVFEINGLTITAQNQTKPGEKVTITTQDDTDGIYDVVKNFLKEYNSIVNEMDKLYNADKTEIEPLTDDEKYALSDKEVEDIEKKLAESALRRDENISEVSQGLKSIMSAGIEINGKTMYLSDFGINTLSYFSAPDNEKNAYHIDGDSDDDSTSGNEDKLKSMIANDPSTTISFFTKLSQNLYDKMTDMSKSVDGYRSFGSFFDDKKIKSDFTEYNSKIADLEKKLNDYEDMWYKKFSKMETAMAKMQSNTSAITSMLGGK